MFKYQQLPDQENEKFTFQFERYLRLSQDIAKEGRTTESGFSAQWLTKDENGKQIAASDNLAEFNRLINKELDKTAGLMTNKGYLTPEIGGMIEKMKKMTEHIYQRTTNLNDDVPEAHYNKVMKRYQEKTKEIEKILKNNG